MFPSQFTSSNPSQQNLKGLSNNTKATNNTLDGSSYFNDNNANEQYGEFIACIGLNVNQKVREVRGAMVILDQIKTTHPKLWLGMAQQLFAACIGLDVNQNVREAMTAMEILNHIKTTDPQMWLEMAQQLFTACIGLNVTYHAMVILDQIKITDPQMWLGMARELFTACVGLDVNQKVREAMTAMEILNHIKITHSDEWLGMLQRFFDVLISTNSDNQIIDHQLALLLFAQAKAQYPDGHQIITEMNDKLIALDPLKLKLKNILTKGGCGDYEFKINWSNLPQDDGFREFIDHIEGIKDMQSTSPEDVKRDAYKKLAKVIIAMDNNDNIRHLCKEYAKASLGNCNDAINDGFVNMQLMVLLYDEDVTPGKWFDSIKYNAIYKIIMKWIGRAVNAQLEQNPNADLLEIELKMKQILLTKYIPDIAPKDILFGNLANIEENNEFIQGAIEEIEQSIIAKQNAIYSDMLLSNGVQYRNPLVNKLYPKALNYLFNLIDESVWLETGKDAETKQEKSRIEFLKLMEEIYKSTHFTDDEKQDILNIVNRSDGIYYVTSGLEMLIGECDGYANEYNKLKTQYDINKKALEEGRDKLKEDRKYFSQCEDNVNPNQWVKGTFNCHSQYPMMISKNFTEHKDAIKNNIAERSDELEKWTHECEQMQQQMIAREHKVAPARKEMLARLRILFTTEIK